MIIAKNHNIFFLRRFFHYFTQLFLPSTLILSVSYLSLYTLPIMEVSFTIQIIQYRASIFCPQYHGTRMCMATFNITLLITLILYAYR